MKFIQAFTMALAAIRAKKVRSFLTILGTIIGVAAVIALASVTEANNKKQLETMMWMSPNTITVYAYTWQYEPPVGRGQTISEKLSFFISNELADVTLGVTPVSTDWGKKIQYGSKVLGDNTNFYYGSDQFSLCMGYEIAQGRDLCYLDVQRALRVCVLGSRSAESLFGLQDPVGKMITVSGQPFTVVGVYEQKDYQTESEWVEYSQDFMLVLPYTAAKHLGTNNRTSEYMVKCVDAFSVNTATDMIKEFLSTLIDTDQNGWYSVYAQNEYLSTIEATNKEQMVFMICIAAISLLVGGIGIMNIMLVTVTERTREIGIRKAIGAPRRSIITQFLIEASVLSLLGGLFGVIVGFAGTLFWGQLQYQLYVVPNLFFTALALLISVALGIGFGIYPAIKASGLQPVEALRND